MYGIEIGDNQRDLTDGERRFAEIVFQDSVDYDQVRISDGIGLDGRPFTVPVALTSEGLLRKYVDLITLPYQGVLRYVVPDKFAIFINFGPQGYVNALSDSYGFIHEMTHELGDRQCVEDIAVDEIQRTRDRYCERSDLRQAKV